MKAPAFDYVKPSSLSEVFALLTQHGAGAQILAGGQSLMAIMNLRLAMPELLIDITGLPDLDVIEESDRGVRIGALVTHTQLQNSELVASHVPLLAQAVPHVAHMAIRNSGTLGGSLALADPAAEYPAVALALNATLHLQGPMGAREVRAENYFLGLYETARQADELLVGVTFPSAQPGDVMLFDELTRRRGDYALCGLAAALHFEAGQITSARFAYLSMGDKPTLALRAAEQVVSGTLDMDLVAAAQEALHMDLSPHGDVHGSAKSKLQWAKVLLGRALKQSMEKTHE